MTAPEIHVHLRAPVRDTEVPERVREALVNVFPDADVEVREGEVVGAARTLDHLTELIANHRIPDTARTVMLRGRDPVRLEVTRFTLGKQAAFVGKPAFAPPPSPLGDIHVEVVARDADALEEVVYAVAPDTTVPEELARVPPAKRPEPEPDPDADAEDA